MDYGKLSSDRLGESSANVRARVESARERQRARLGVQSLQTSGKITYNSDMRVAEVRQFCKLDETSESLISAVISQLQLSARVYHRILKLARPIADLARSDAIQSVHLAEALHASQSSEVEYDVNQPSSR